MLKHVLDICEKDGKFDNVFLLVLLVEMIQNFNYFSIDIFI